MRAPRLVRAARWAALGVVFAGPAVAQDPEPARVDFFQGPVVSSSRVVGLGGAFIGVAEGADGHLINPAAFVVRPAHTTNDWFDWDVALSFLNVANTDDTDIDQSGRDGGVEDTQHLQLGGNLKFGRHGFGVHFSQQSYTLPGSGDEGTLVYRQTFGGLGYALVLEDTDWVVGGGVMVGAASINLDDEELVKIEGGGLLLGVLWTPDGAAYRAGLTARSKIVGQQVTGDKALVGDRVPDALEIPWQVGAGASYMFGPRRYNRVADFDAEGPPPLARRYVLVAADVVLTGATQDATGVRAFLVGERQPAGRSASFSGRLGVESELLPSRLTGRAGTYYEPNRFETFAGRFHGTVGLDVRVTVEWDWKVAAVVDAADQYLNFGVGLGFWH